MKRFAIIFAANYVCMVLLVAFLLLVVPDTFPGAPPLTGIGRILVLVAHPIGWLTAIYTFPAIFISDYAASFLPSIAGVSTLICLLFPATLWTAVFILIRHYWRVYHAA